MDEELKIDFAFACRDDCLERMVPSDLRALVRERDDLRAQLPSQGGEAVEVVAYIDGGGAIYTAKLLEIMSVESDGCEQLMTVAQHDRIMAATVPAACKVVPVELLRRLADAERNERHRTVQETRYWCDQYKQIARALLASAEGVKDE